MPFSSLKSKYIDPKINLCTCQAHMVDNGYISTRLTNLTSRLDFKQVKEIVIKTHWNTDHPIRRELWLMICDKISTDCYVEQYRVLDKLLHGKGSYQQKTLSEIVNPIYSMPYLLNAEGKKCVENIIHIIRHAKPDIEYCLFLYPLVTIFLHYMSEEMTFSCVLKLLYYKQPCIPQTKLDHMIHGFTVMLLAKKYAYKAYVRLEKEFKKQDFEIFFKHWLLWIFNALPFPYLVRVIDCFLVETNIFLYRMFLALLILYDEHADMVANEKVNIIHRLRNYIKNISMPADMLFKVAYNINGLSVKNVNLQIKKAEVMAVRYLSLSEDNVTTNHAFIIEEKSGETSAEAELEMYKDFIPGSNWILTIGHYKSEIVNPEQLTLIYSWLPLRITLMKPEVVYSSNNYGLSLNAFLKQVDDLEQSVLIVKSTNDEIFGAYCSGSWKSRNKCENIYKGNAYFGTEESFLFALVPRIRVYPWIGMYSKKEIPSTSKLFMAANDNTIFIGSGIRNGNGLVFHDPLKYGRTEHCDTFDNEPLCSTQNFRSKIVEVLAFK